MQTDRRSVLRAGGVLAAMGMTGLAGCSGIMGGGEPPGPADYRYDPSAIAEAKNKFFGTVDYAGLYEQREYFPESTRKSFESSEDSPVSPENVDTMTGVGGAQITVGEGTSTAVFGSIVVLGSFPGSAIESNLKDDGATKLEEYEGFTLYENAGSAADSDIASNQNTTAVAAVRDGVVIAGVAGSQGEAATDVTSEQAARTMIDAANGNVDRLEPNSETAKQLGERFGDSSVMFGVEIDPGLITALEAMSGQGQSSMSTQFVQGLTAGGFGMTVDGETTTMEGALLYEDATAAEESGVVELVDLTSEQLVAENEGLDTFEAEYADNAAVLTIEGKTETIFEEGTSATGAGTDASVSPVSESATLGLSSVTGPANIDLSSVTDTTHLDLSSVTEPATIDLSAVTEL